MAEEIHDRRQNSGDEREEEQQGGEHEGLQEEEGLPEEGASEETWKQLRGSLIEQLGIRDEAGEGSAAHQAAIASDLGDLPYSSPLPRSPQEGSHAFATSRGTPKNEDKDSLDNQRTPLAAPKKISLADEHALSSESPGKSPSLQPSTLQRSPKRFNLALLLRDLKGSSVAIPVSTTTRSPQMTSQSNHSPAPSALTGLRKLSAFSLPPPALTPDFSASTHYAMASDEGNDSSGDEEELGQMPGLGAAPASSIVND